MKDSGLNSVFVGDIWHTVLEQQMLFESKILTRIVIFWKTLQMVDLDDTIKEGNSFPLILLWDCTDIHCIENVNCDNTTFESSFFNHYANIAWMISASFCLISF